MRSKEQNQAASAGDVRWMRRALELAAQGRGRAEPNPPVGAVIVRRGKLVGEGFHERFGGPHAEIRAMDAAAGACRGATLYVTLEPCTGLSKKTPPCCDAVLKAGFRRVVIGAGDPTQQSAVPRLEAAGIAVVTGVLEKECLRMIAPFLKLRARGMPYVIAKWAMTADGKIATVTGESRWISSDASRDLVHRWRNQADAVLVGIGTVLRDDPLLTCRPFEFAQGGPEQLSKDRVTEARNPLRIVLDAEARIPLTSRLVATAREAPLLIACLASVPPARRRRLTGAGCRVLPLRGARGRVDAEQLLRALGAERITNLMVEGGAGVLADFFDHRLVDEVRIFIAPKLFGGAAAPGPIGGKGIPSPADAMKLRDAVWTPVGRDMLLSAMTDFQVPSSS
ncbi:MAG: bifunctional diaminohydroxyphosphoribosylaminopyrimidine deaminase/5-amino-6-(5-phosphoribosylamino)uracil reductase RibD [Candidatus Brocadiia bacterium]|jgi:diaminohydroxyphosphoribosylaminopyrimidine deaminase/5-amino-6-(5-phosphoribosylamino)uracil reductase